MCRRKSFENSCINWRIGSPIIGKTSDSLPVSPNAKPGAIAAALPNEGPEEGESFEDDHGRYQFADSSRNGPLGTPAVCGLFWIDHHRSRPGRRNDRLGLQRKRHDLADFARRDRAGNGRLGMAPEMAWPNGFIRRSRLRYRVHRNHACPGRGSGRSCAVHSQTWAWPAEAIFPGFRIYASDQTHSSVEKAAIALGLGEENVRRVRSDPSFRMDVDALAPN